MADMNGVLERLVKYKIFVVEGPGKGAAVAGAGAENASNLLTINVLLLLLPYSHPYKTRLWGGSKFTYTMLGGWVVKNLDNL